jgi:hypothetical protein
MDFWSRRASAVLAAYHAIKNGQTKAQAREFAEANSLSYLSNDAFKRWVDGVIDK